ncbi:MAG: AI-2E family transporter [Candidatus Zixiibacteriota bacterium]|jgi:sporulation integral membrane protein YtvI
MAKFTGKYDEILRGVVLLVLLGLLLWHFLAAVDVILTPLVLGLAIIIVSFAMRTTWARGVGYFVAALGVMWFVSEIWGLLFPFLAGFVIAYLLSPIVDRLHERGVPRGLSALVLILLALMAVAAALLIVVPPIIVQISQLVAALGHLPGQLQDMMTRANEWVISLEDYEMSPYAQPLVDNLATRSQDLFADVLERILNFVTSVSKLATHIVNIVITPIFTFYLLRDMPKIKKWIRERIPRRILTEATETAREIDQVLSGFIRGQFIVSTIEAGFISLGLTVIGVESALLLGLFAGFANMIPYVGTYIGAIPALIVILLGEDVGRKLVLSLILYVIVNVVDGYILAPRIVGKRVGLHPVVTMIAMLAGAKFFGVVGFLAAVPVTATLKIFAKKLEKAYLNGSFFRHPPKADDA